MALELRCPNHPAYTGQRKPKGSAVNDPDCWELYQLKHPEYSVDTKTVSNDEQKLTDIPAFLDKTKEVN